MDELRNTVLAVAVAVILTACLCLARCRLFGSMG